MLQSRTRLLASSNGEHQQHFCLNCPPSIPQRGIQNKHYKYCVHNEVVRIDMREENSFVRFHNEQYQFKVPFVIYADFEAIFKGLEEETDRGSATGSTMKRMNCYIPSGFCTCSTCVYGEVKDLLGQGLCRGLLQTHRK